MRRRQKVILKISKWFRLDWVVGVKIFGWSLDNHYGGSWGMHFHTRSGYVVYCGRGSNSRKDY